MCSAMCTGLSATEDTSSLAVAQDLISPFGDLENALLSLTTLLTIESYNDVVYVFSSPLLFPALRRTLDVFVVRLRFAHVQPPPPQCPPSHEWSNSLSECVSVYSAGMHCRRPYVSVSSWLMIFFLAFLCLGVLVLLNMVIAVQVLPSLLSPFSLCEVIVVIVVDGFVCGCGRCEGGRVHFASARACENSHQQGAQDTAGRVPPRARKSREHSIVSLAASCKVQTQFYSAT